MSFHLGPTEAGPVELDSLPPIPHINPNRQEPFSSVLASFNYPSHYVLQTWNGVGVEVVRRQAAEGKDSRKKERKLNSKSEITQRLLTKFGAGASFWSGGGRGGRQGGGGRGGR